MLNNPPVRIVLLQPPLKNIIGAATPDYVDENRGFSPPMGLLYLQAALEKTEHKSVFLDANLENWTHEQAAEKALEHNPHIVGIQALTFTLPDVYLTALAIKKLNPAVAVLIGGAHPTIFPKQTVGLEGIDFAFAGEGENWIIKFLDAFFDLDIRESVPGFAYKKQGIVHYNPSVELISDLDSLEFPARRSAQFKRYYSVLSLKTPSTAMLTSRGCPFNCIFCNRMGRKYRMHSADYVLAEFDDIASLGIREVFIQDDTFSLDRARIEKICKGLINRKHDIVWQARTRVDCVDRELLTLMHRAGCNRLSFGVESGSLNVLKSMRKETTPAQAIQAFKLCKEIGIITLAHFLIGNIDETEADIVMTMNLMKKLNPGYAHFSICSPYPGTPLYNMALEKGIIKQDVWDDFANNPLAEFSSPLWTQYFSEVQLKNMLKRSYQLFYLRPSFICRQLRCIKNFSQFKALVRLGSGMLMR